MIIFTCHSCQVRNYAKQIAGVTTIASIDDCHFENANAFIKRLRSAGWICLIYLQDGYSLRKAIMQKYEKEWHIRNKKREQLGRTALKPFNKDRIRAESEWANIEPEKTNYFRAIIMIPYWAHKVLKLF